MDLDMIPRTVYNCDKSVWRIWCGQCSACTDDLLKIVHSLICILKADARTYPESSMTVFKKLKAFSVQPVRTTVILSEIHNMALLILKKTGCSFQNVKCVQMKESKYPKTIVLVERHIYQPFLRGSLFRACDTWFIITRKDWWTNTISVFVTLRL